MSDDDESEYEYEYDSDAEFEDDDGAGSAADEDADGADGGGADGGEGGARRAQIELENTFYEAEDFRQRGELAEAAAYFERVVALEEASGAAPDARKWSFPAHENLVKLCAAARRWDDMVTHYRAMLAHLAFVTRNESTAAVSSVLDVVSQATAAASAKQGDADGRLAKYTSAMYELTLERLKDGNNERLWFTMKVKLGKLYLDMRAFAPLQVMLDELYEYCGDGETDHSKATLLLDVYALEIQMCGATRNTARMRIVYPKTLRLDAAIADPRVMGVIREEGGKMYLEEGAWMLAYNEFFESFRNHQEAGNARAVQVLKYVVLANMLASSDINPFDSREAKVYQDVDEIAAMLLLRNAYEASDVVQFEKILQHPKYRLLSDPIMTKYLNPLLRSIRCQVLKKLVRPYDVMQLASLARSMNIAVHDVEELAVALIQNRELDAKIDQTRGLIVLTGRRQKNRDANRMYDAIDRWTRALDTVHSTVAARVHM